MLAQIVLMIVERYIALLTPVVKTFQEEEKPQPPKEQTKEY
jgi:hypothetical protein